MCLLNVYNLENYRRLQTNSSLALVDLENYACENKVHIAMKCKIQFRNF